MFNINNKVEYGIQELIFLAVLMGKHPDYKVPPGADFLADRKHFFAYLVEDNDWGCALECLLMRDPTDEEVVMWIHQLNDEKKLAPDFLARDSVKAILAMKRVPMATGMHGAN